MDKTRLQIALGYPRYLLQPVYVDSSRIGIAHNWTLRVPNKLTIINFH